MSKVIEKMEEGNSPSSINHKTRNLMDNLILRQSLYRLFSSLFLYPDEKLISFLQVGAEEILSNIEFWKKEAYSENLQEILRELIHIESDNRKIIIDEFNRLFLIKPKAPPYETVYMKLPGQSEGVISAEISGIYGLAGLAVDPEKNDLPDHIAIELEFMAFLCEKEFQGFLDEDENAISTAQVEQKEFMNKHLSKWYPQFAKKTLEETGDTIYRDVIGVVFAFLRNELKLLKLRG